jgi:hypothetical protein
MHNPARPTLPPCHRSAPIGSIWTPSEFFPDSCLDGCTSGISAAERYVARSRLDAQTQAGMASSGFLQPLHAIEARGSGCWRQMRALQHGLTWYLQVMVCRRMTQWGLQRPNDGTLSPRIRFTEGRGDGLREVLDLILSRSLCNSATPHFLCSLVCLPVLS